MKKAFLGTLIFASMISYSQEIDFSVVSFKSWGEQEKNGKLFSLFEENVPTDGKLAALFSQLLDADVMNVNVRSKNGKKTLFDACLETGRFETAKLLIEKGYKINQRCFQCNGETPLLKAIYASGEMKEPNEELKELMMLMIEKGADPDLRDMKGYTSLHWAIKNKDVMAFEVLMSPNVKLNEQLATLKGKGYLKFFDQHWNEDEYREKLMEKTGLKYPPTKKEIREKQKAAKEKAREGKKKKDQSP